MIARAQLWGDYLLLAVAIGLAWQAGHALTGDEGLASPAATLGEIVTLAGTAEFWGHLAETGKAFAAAALISAAGGIMLGLILGAHRLSGEVAAPVLITFYSLPKVVLYPLLLLIFGLGLPAKIAFGALHGIFPVIIVTMNAVANLNPVYVRTARVLRLPRLDVARRVLIPAIMPEALSGLRVGLSLSLLGVLVGEMFASQRGMGFLIINAMTLGDVKLITATTVILVGIALAINGLMLALVEHLRHGGVGSARVAAE